MKLNEIVADDDKIITWFQKHFKHFEYVFDKKKISVDNGVVNYNGNLVIDGAKKIPYPIGKVTGRFIVRDKGGSSPLQSAENFPKEIGKDILLMECALKSIDDLPTIIVGDNVSIDIHASSVKGIHQKIKKMDGTFQIPPYGIRTGWLDILRINGIKEIYEYEANLKSFPDSIAYNNVRYSTIWQVMQIISKNVGKGKSGILAAQQELIDNDLEDFE